MKLIKDNRGMTLVETIIGVALLAIASVMLVRGFVTTANIVNRATTYKLTSAEATATIELQEVEAGNKIIEENEYSHSSGVIQVTYGPSNAKLNVDGEYIVCTDNDTGLTYKEFLSGNYDVIDPEETS